MVLSFNRKVDGSYSGEQDIEDLADKLYDYKNSLYRDLEVLPCYSALPWEMQEKIFGKAKPNSRKVFLFVISRSITKIPQSANNIECAGNNRDEYCRNVFNGRRSKICRRQRLRKTKSLRPKTTNREFETNRYIAGLFHALTRSR